MSGILYGVGVGPGDPELLTLKALRCIRESDVIVLPSKPKEECYAYRIVKEVYPQVEEKEIICMPFPMIKDKAVLKKVHNEIYEGIAGLLDKNKAVAFLTIGDPSVYSTYSYIHHRVVQNHGRAEMISGIPSFCAAAAALGISHQYHNQKQQEYDFHSSSHLHCPLTHLHTGNPPGFGSFLPIVRSV
jgi:precorrin-2/cobalt-factor-2 C20-methyltransferase